MVDLIQCNSVTSLSMVPSMLREFLRFVNCFGSTARNKIESLCRIVTGGEALDVSVVEAFHQLFKGECHLEQVYGPTEATVNVTHRRMCYKSSLDIASVGTPISNTKAYVIGECGSLQPVGVAGELCVSGDCLSRGYLNRPDLTSEAFVENPFMPGTRMYRTGDLTRWRNDGSIEFLGRIDRQVKTRGLRIELAEIEHWLQQEDGVKGCVVVDCSDPTGDKHLCAYLLSDERLDLSTIGGKLREHLPYYMVPSYYVKLDEIPLTRHGKVDRKALPMPTQAMALVEAYVAPATTLEEKLAQIWLEVLGLEKVGVQSDFFHLGGHSLKVIQLLSRIEHELGVCLSFKEIFQFPTVRQQAQLMLSQSRTRKNVLKPIGKIEERKYYRCNQAQRPIFIMNRIDCGSTNYNMPFAFRMEGPLDVKQLEAALQLLVIRHEAFRTSFEIKNWEPVQKIHPVVEFHLPREVLGTDRKDVIRARLSRLVAPFDLGVAPLLRARLLVVSAKCHILFVDMHHIVSDAVSLTIFFRELGGLNSRQSLSPLKITCKDYAAWENAAVAQGLHKKSREYWLNEFKGELPVLTLPVDFARPPVQSFQGSCVSFGLSEKESEQLRHLIRTSGVTNHIMLLALFSVWLHHYCGTDDLIVGTVSDGRQHSDANCLIGMFVRTLPVRVFLRPEQRFLDLLQEVKTRAVCAHENQIYPFDELVENVNITHDPSRNPLFDVMCVFEESENQSMLSLEGLTVNPIDVRNPSAKFDLTLFGRIEDDSYWFSFEYTSKLFLRSTVERMSRHFLHLIREVLVNPNQGLGGLSMISDEERHVLLDHFLSTALTSGPPTVHERFEKQAHKSPDYTALRFRDWRMSYRELNHRSNILARRLRDCGIVPGEPVGIAIERSFEMVIGVLGVLKSGGAYLPLDTDYPKSRIDFMLCDSGAKIVLTTKRHSTHVAFSRLLVLCLDDDMVFFESSPKDAEDLDSRVGASHLAYVMYTSGSTGRPKGVKVQHGGLVNMLEQLNRKYPLLGVDDTMLQLTSISFDGSVDELFRWFFAGCSLTLAAPGVNLDPKEIISCLERDRISHVYMVPSMCRLVLKEIRCTFVHLPHLKYVFNGGQVVDRNLIELFFATFPDRTTRYVNVYGPTEATDDVTTYDVVESDAERPSVPIGRPLPNVQIYVMDNSATKLQPLGIPGELCVGGEGVARGYVNYASLTEERFVENPFRPGTKMYTYRTGDVARWLGDGNLAFVGRLDGQVKVRGFRVELGEVEAHVRLVDCIHDCVVAVREDLQDDNTLRAYVVPNTDFDLADVLVRLHSELPDFMVPSTFSVVEKIPLLHSGKVDREGLLSSDVSLITAVPFVAPTTPLEKALSTIWREVLEVEDIGVTSDFFDTLGGTSMSAIRVVTKIREKICPDFSVRDFLVNRTITQQTKKISLLTSVMHQESGFVLDELVDSPKPTNIRYRKPPSWLRGSLQTLGAFLISAVASLAIFPAILLMELIYLRLGLFVTIFLAPLAPVVLMLASAVLVALTKWLLIGRYHPGVHRLWSWYFLRWWFVGRLISYMNTVLGSWIRGSVFMRIWQIMLGAKIGHGTVLSTVYLSEPDLINIGAHVTVDEDARICGHTFHKGQLIIGPLMIGSGSYIGHKSVIMPHCIVEDNVTVEPQSLITSGMTCEQGSSWLGSPATQQGTTTREAMPPMHPFVAAWKVSPLSLVFLQAIGVTLLAAAVVVALAPMILLAEPLQQSLPAPLGPVVLLTIGPFIGVTVFSMIAVLARWALIGRSRPGRYEPGLWLAFRQWLVDRLLSSILVEAFTSVLWSSVLSNWFYRLAGVVIGRHTVVSPLVLHHDADLLKIGNGVWIGSRLKVFPTALDLDPEPCPTGVGPASIRKQAAPVIIGDHCMVAEHCLMLPGVDVGRRTSVGSWSVLSQNQHLPEGSVWLGSPSIMLLSDMAGTHNTEAERTSNITSLQSLAGWDPRLSEERTFYSFGRAFEILLIIFFLLLQAAALAPCVMLFDLILPHIGSSLSFSLVPMLFLTYGFISFFISVVVKTVAMPYFRGNHPYWSLSFLAWRFILALVGFGMSIIYPNVRGSSVGVLALRLYGAKVGKDVFFDTVPSCEMDLVNIGNSVILQEETALMPHVVDNGRLQYGPVVIEDGCTVNACSTLLPGSVMRRNSTLGPLSVVMKGEVIPSQTYWVGNPAYAMHGPMASNRNSANEWSV